MKDLGRESGRVHIYGALEVAGTIERDRMKEFQPTIPKIYDETKPSSRGKEHLSNGRSQEIESHKVFPAMARG